MRALEQASIRRNLLSDVIPFISMDFIITNKANFGYINSRKIGKVIQLVSLSLIKKAMTPI
ncbi:hypothetical protein PBN151_0443 [Paenibacillus sp. NAIST15-1]|nr:hypothetical protein PBN151_0443 [Paenibacillus sp. NAIST15-1]